MSARQTLLVASRSLTETCAALLACAVRFLRGIRFRASCGPAADRSSFWSPAGSTRGHTQSSPA
ncbi:hypothetical protein PR003_g21485 [Phytophthora rubi]|uniref:Uncharacterized protein n=1 Tax=Phytophthora rubi TaxID=129364 RepID=A0A6A4DFP9_9STRA|nr:hypothetical protein PR001_g15957 [Phytophthora rubi]KAE9305474.1 hypothetical protein PR003_g21485 [Phytophthora rubi]